MENKRPLLSICIPTYNRCDVLRSVLEKYVANPAFDEDVEIVVSDNASTDNTLQICSSFAERYRNIRYYRNEVNIMDANFPLVLSYGQGRYLKLLNDWIYITKENLEYMKTILRANELEKRLVFFTNDWLFTQYKTQEFIEGKGLDEYVQVVSTFVTSNNLFGAWKEHWEEIKDKSKFSELKLQQEDWTYSMLKQHPSFFVCNKELFNYSDVFAAKVRGGYNWFQIHLDNYYIIMQPYIEKGLITQDTLIKDKRNLLQHFKFELGWALFYNYNKYWKFETDGLCCLLYKYYKADWYAYWFFLMLPLHYCANVFIKLLHKCIHGKK